MKTLMKSTLVFAVFIGLSSLGFATDFSALKPPPGVKVAVVVFEDLECPTCARAFPIIWDVAKAHNIPVLLHDFPLTNIHPWAFRASLYARFFDTHSQKLGDDFRGYIYRNQYQIFPGNLDDFARKYADDNKAALPFAIDPQGKLKEKVNADYELGLRLGVGGTPAIYIVGNSGKGQPLVDEIKDPNTLSETFGQKIEEMEKKAVAPPGSAPVKHAASKPHKKKPS
jgi:protein-disulfide isomerase